ncbi:uncharacterized protein EV420DRAFT_1586883 [Desarmillaria tabescens]|uniref:Uncharacterized protein n=1 Tax=Armillaria tabescens TaxID=1929756 RepID=A0AA39JC01_ARMTA|nr:uncharacterized protein EV420DRAFT_1586883 [Desarmillaria tabescens]KAK0437908.1 hypothetical protein EV420DRAFT_1586883 [Desarmillaria tabescens]
MTMAKSCAWLDDQYSEAVDDKTPTVGCIASSCSRRCFLATFARQLDLFQIYQNSTNVVQVHLQMCRAALLLAKFHAASRPPQGDVPGLRKRPDSSGHLVNEWLIGVRRPLHRDETTEFLPADEFHRKDAHGLVSLRGYGHRGSAARWCLEGDGRLRRRATRIC